MKTVKATWNVMEWIELERCPLSKKGVGSLLEASYQSEAVKWCNGLRLVIDFVLFLGERGLAFSGSAHGIGDPSNDNFHCLFELLAWWDLILQEHVQNVREYQGIHIELGILAMITSMVCLSCYHGGILYYKNMYKMLRNTRKKANAYKFITYPKSQNECISACSNLVKRRILLERKISAYFAVIADATPDSSHVEQTTFLYRYLTFKG